MVSEQLALLIKSLISINCFCHSFSSDYFSKFSAECDIFRLLDKAEVTNFESVDTSRTDYLLNVIEGNVTNVVKKDELMSSKGR